MLEVHELTCLRGDRLLFSRLSFALRAGECLHVRGRNGSGKTSLLRIVCGLSTPQEGEVRWRGRRIDADREEFAANLAYVGHQNGVQENLTPAENLSVDARLHGAEIRVEAVLTEWGLDGLDDLPARFLSQGQRRRLALARLGIGDKPLWILDEPFTALDVDSVARVLARVRAHVGRGGAAILTSHQTFDLPTRALDLARPAGPP